MSKVILVDASHLLSRTFHVPSFQSLKTVIDGQEVLTGAAFGFIQSIKKMYKDLKQEKDKLIVVWDGGGKGFRNTLDPLYKANRPSRTPDYLFQIGITQEFLKALGVLQCQTANVEADDLIGILTKQARLKGYQVLIISGDKDFNQLVSNNVHVLHPGTGQEDDKLITPEEVKERYGIAPHLFISWLSLTGDSSDNISGIDGVGKKTAAELILCNGDIDSIINSDVHYKFKKDKKVPISDKLQEKINSSKEKLRLAKQLVTIKLDMDIDIEIEQVKPNLLYLKELFKTYSFTSQLQKFDEFVAIFS